MTLVGDDAPTLAMTTSGTPVTPVRSTMRQALRDATLGEYEILSELGRGGMATVFLAHDIALDRKVAIKVMAPHLLEGEGMAERFKLEARTAAQLSHPHIIPIYAVKETSETLYFVMKYVEGRGLDAVIKKTGQLPITMVTDILVKVGGALGYAHRRDVVHRDIKPANIMIDEEGTPIVTDFGIAKVAETKGLTITGATIGTPSYMSPEQCEAKQVTGASDQYSLGVVAFEMLTGQLPFEGDSAVTTMYKHCHEPLPPLADSRPDCPAEVRETVERMVAKKPADRWPSLEAAIRRLTNDATPSGLDPIRSQLLELVREGDTDQLLARLSNPGGPVLASTGSGTTRTAAAPAGSRSGRLGVIGVVALVAIGGTLAVLQPWSSEAPASLAGTPTPASTQDADGTGPPTGQPGLAGGGDATTEPGSAGDPSTSTAEATPSDPTLDVPSGGGTATAAGGSASPPPTPTISRIQITGSPQRLQPGGTATLAATPVDARGVRVPGSSARWTSSDESIVRVSQSGLVSAFGPGQAVLTAAAGNVSGSVTITVAEAAVAAVVLGPTSLELTVGDRASIEASARGADGEALDGRQVTWRSSSESVVSVGASGQLTAAGPGTATITATSEGVSATADVTVRVATRVAVDEVVEAYARALESRDVDRVRAVYPGMTPEREAQLQSAFPAMEGLRVETTVDSIEEDGNNATAGVSATYRFRAGGRDQVQAVPLRFSFARTPTGWRVSSIQ